MAKGKSVKIDYKGIKAQFSNGELTGVLEVVDEETGEVSISDMNLTTEIKDFLKTLNGDDKVSICIKKFKPMSARSKKQIFKYHCECEGSEIKSEYDSLNIHCNVCDEDFRIEE